MKGATFAWNTTVGSGGAIYDTADFGGAIVTNSTFYGNTAAEYGGAIFDVADTGGMFSHDVIYDNRAGGGGGGIVDHDFSAIENCEISAITPARAASSLSPAQIRRRRPATPSGETAPGMAAGSTTKRY